MEVSAKILLFATLRDKYGVKELNVRCNGTIRSLIENAAKIIGGSFISDVLDKSMENVRDDLIFMINGRNIKDIKGKIEIRNGDVVAIFPPFAGG
jgi:molybdopterin synthase sulfur carrier subunit